KSRHDASFTTLKDRVFPTSLPRLIQTYGADLSFNSISGTNAEFYEKAWNYIKEDAEKYLGFQFSNPPVRSKDQYGADLLDGNGIPIIAGSDGKAHFLALILEIRKHPKKTVFLIEEPDAFLHPGLQKVFLKYLFDLRDKEGHQFFVA